MPTTIIRGSNKRQLDVLIVGGGVAAIEALLALRDLAGERVDVVLLAPEPDFVFRPLAVGAPFGLGEPKHLELARIAREHGAGHRVDALAGVVPDRRVAVTAAGEELTWDLLLLAPGAQAVDTLPNALTYRGEASTEAIRKLLGELDGGAINRVAFAASPLPRWPLPLYELALLTAKHVRDQGRSEAEVVVVTSELRPLEMFGSTASEEVGRLLEEADVELVTGARAKAFSDHRLELESGASMVADRVVALPKLHVPTIEGIPQGANGFIPTDEVQLVEGMSDVYAAGDATWFPIKHGGLAARQADIAAGEIAHRAGVDRREAPDLVLRGALLTGSATEYLRQNLDEGSRDSTAALGALWSPPGKIAGRYLAPYLGLRLGDEQQSPVISDLAAEYRRDPAGSDAAHKAALDLALTAADAEARWGDYSTAVRWLDVAEQLNVVLPSEYVERRGRWRREGH